MSKGNVVISGDYAGSAVIAEPGGRLVLMANTGNPIYLNAETVAKFDVISDTESRSTGSAVKRAAVGRALMGRKAMVVGAATAKKVTTYEVAVDFKDGKRSLIQMSEDAYKMLARNSFA